MFGRTMVRCVVVALGFLPHCACFAGFARRQIETSSVACWTLCRTFLSRALAQVWGLNNQAGQNTTWQLLLHIDISSSYYSNAQPWWTEPGYADAYGNSNAYSMSGCGFSRGWAAGSVAC